MNDKYTSLQSSNECSPADRVSLCNAWLGSLDEGNCLKSVMMVSLVTPGTLGTRGMQSLVTRASRMWPAGSWLPGTPAIHESCRELTRTRRMCRPVKNLWTKVLRSPAAAANMQIAEDTQSDWRHFSAQFWFAWIQYLMLRVGLSAISWPGLGTKHKNQYRLWTLGPWLLTSHTHMVTSLTQEAPCQALSLSAAMFTLVFVFPSALCHMWGPVSALHVTCEAGSDVSSPHRCDSGPGHGQGQQIHRSPDC